MLTTIALLLAGTIPLLPAAFEGHFSRTHEGMRYEHLAALFLDALRHGVLYPRWLPNLTGGYGYPMFVFYQPVVFYVASAISAVFGVGMILAMQFTALVFSTAGSFGAFTLSRQFGVGRLAGVASAMLFLITPYAFSNLYVRGDHSEFAAMMLTPWPLGFLLIAMRRMNERSPRVATPLFCAAITTSLIIATHPAVAMFFVPLLFAIAAVGTAFVTRPQRLRWLISLACVGVIAAALSSAYWFPVFQNKPFVRMDDVSSGPYDPLQHTIDAWRLVANTWGYGDSGWKTRGLPPTMSFQLGLPHLLLALAGVIVGWRRPWVIACAVTYAALAFMTTRYADALWSGRSPIRIIQFPWRLLGVIAPLQLLLASAAIAKLAPRRQVVQGWIAIACVVVSAIWYHAMFHASPKPFNLVNGTVAMLSWQRAQLVLDDGIRTIRHFPEDFSGQGEFMPRWAPEKIPAARVGPQLTADGVFTIAPGNSDYRIDATITSQSPQRPTLQQLYFPGWRVELNGRTLPFAELSPDAAGRIQFDLPAGTNHVIAYFDGPPHWRSRSLIAALIAISAIALTHWLNAPRPRPDMLAAES